jgi:nitrous oxidase accessory protein NosD
LIKGNTVADNVDTGIRIALSEDDALIADNVITGNRVGIECVQSAPKIRRNVIEGNQIGIQSKQEDAPDLGKDDDPGFNVIKDNKIQVMNTERHHTIQAKHNYWGRSAGPDTSGFEGKVNYTPWLETDPLKAQAVRSQGRLIATWGRIRKDRPLCSDDLCGAVQ